MTKQIDTEAYTVLDFTEVEKASFAFADHIKKNTEAIIDILLEYESFEVAHDEIGRTLDLLTHLKENEAYFKLRIGRSIAFMPRNQPLYAFTCFVVIPSLMANEVHFRIPTSMKEFLPKLFKVLVIGKFFPNVFPSDEIHNVFLKKHSALKINPKTQETVPVTDAVIFTGTPTRADQLRSVFDSRTLFITNGSGHNPVIIAEDADIEKAVDAVLCVQLYNQGQDCAAPNAILVHKKIFDEVNALIHKKLPSYKVGEYRDRTCQIGPISDPFDLVRIEEFLIENRQFLDPKTPGILRAAHSIVEPTIIQRSLKDGANYVEMFAPIIFLQMYEADADLSTYFETHEYLRNAMYVTIYGTSAYGMSLVGKKFNGKLLHDKFTILHNTHLHAEGIERGTQPYGGYGYGASNLWVRGEGISKPTLPQRDIFQQVAEPILKLNNLEQYRKDHGEYVDIEEKNIEKLLRLASPAAIKAEIEESRVTSKYFDLNSLAKDQTKRYIKIDPLSTFELLVKPNVQYLTNMTPASIKNIIKLRELLQNKPESKLEFDTALYAIVGHFEDEAEKKAQQKIFFEHTYNLLFGKKIGPKLTTFLYEIPVDQVYELLNI
ncbi:MAG: hypothetical protein JWP09_520 [Candidatus Taylorbacteria bacterium]|nr:hypothetical protein [Candidatus Taylorbacteria bacterium]